jgi:tetratricopeptide (TPR) repeat protein
MFFASTLAGCSGLGLFGGQSEPARIESKEPPKADAFADTRARIQAAPREPYWPFHLAELYLAADSSAEAVQNLNAALAIDESYAPAVSLLSRIYYDAKMHPQAVSLLEGYLSRHPDAPEALRAALALHCEALGDGQKADAALADCAPDARDIQCARVLATLRQNDADAMVDAARRALETDRKSAANHNNHGIALLVAGRPVEARDAFRAALAIDGDLPGALYNMAIVEAFYFFDDGAGRDWYARYRRVADEDPDNLKAHFEADVSTTEPARR